MTYAATILQGLDEVAVPEYPGDIIVSNNAQPILINPIKGNCLLAACIVGKGKLLVASHSSFLDFLSDNYKIGADETDKKAFSENLTRWLCIDNNRPFPLVDTDVADISEISEFDKISTFRLIKWNNMVTVPEELTSGLLLSYLLGGGALFVAATPWSYLQKNPSTKLEDIQVYNFLIGFGMQYTSGCIRTPSTIDVSDTHLDPEFAEISLSDFSSQIYHQEILRGFDKVPAPCFPGSIIVAGNSQAVLTSGHSPSQVIIAAVKYGAGRIINCAHSFYLDCLEDEATNEQKNFSSGLIKWLTQGQLVEQEWKFIYADKFDKHEAVTDKLVVKWTGDIKTSDKQKKDIMNYIKSGGYLLAAVCPWQWLQKNPGRRLCDMDLYCFLKKFCMFYSSQCLRVDGREIRVDKNLAAFSNFDKSIEQLTNPSNKDFVHWIHTFTSSYSILDSENYLTKKKIDQIQSVLVRLCHLLDKPSQKVPITDSVSRTHLSLLGKCLDLTSNIKAPGIDNFPGDFDKLPELMVGVRISLSTQFAMDRLSTGYYLPAGCQLSVRLMTGGTDMWAIRIGAHTDQLEGSEALCRWPNVSVLKVLNDDEIFVSSAYGGLVYFESLKADVSIEAIIGNVVESPYFDLTLPATVDDWPRRMNAPGLWCELAGEYIVFTAPSYCVRQLKTPADILQFWDKVCVSSHALRGSIPSEQRRERVVSDVQLARGKDMHCGYPICTSLDYCDPDRDDFLFDVDKLRIFGHKRLFSELGHNMKREEWTFDGSGDVIANLFTMHSFYDMLGKEVNELDWLHDKRDQITEYFTRSDHSYEDWRANSNAIGLYMFALLIKSFGWESIYRFMEEYEEDIRSGYEVSGGNGGKLDQWVLRYSRICGYNVRPHFLKFGLPVSERVSVELAELEPLSLETDTGLFFLSENE